MLLYFTSLILLSVYDSNMLVLKYQPMILLSSDASLVNCGVYCVDSSWAISRGKYVLIMLMYEELLVAIFSCYIARSGGVSGRL